MPSNLAIKSETELENISESIFGRKNAIGFDQRDIFEYDWDMTQYLYGRGFYLGILAYASKSPKEVGAIPILHDDSSNTWSVPIYRHYKRKLEFFIPGIVLGAPTRYILGYEFYPLSDEEKEVVRRIVHERFDVKILKEMEALKEYLSNYCSSQPIIHADPGQITFLFGSELYKGEDPQQFKGRMLKLSRGLPNVEIWPSKS